MQSFTYTIRDENGIHARPAGKLVKIAKNLASASTIEFNGKHADISKLFAVMSMGIKQGDAVTINVDGSSEKDDVVILQNFFNEHL